MTDLKKEYQKDSYELDASPIKGQNFKGISTTIPVHVLVDHYCVDETRGNEDNGYQRPHQHKRSAILAERLLYEDVVLPLSFTVNIRDANVYSEIKNNKFKYVPKVHNKLWVVDGQHRVRALEIALQEAEKIENKGEAEKNFRRLAEKTVPVTITFTKDKFTEMELFSEVNSYQKGVSVDQQIQNSVKRVKGGDTEHRDKLEKYGLLLEEFTIPNLVMKLNKDSSSLWYNKIKSPGGKADTPNVGINSMSKYFGLMYETDALFAKNIHNDSELSLSIFNAYWHGLENSYPEMFKFPKKYSVQKAVGADVFMRLLGPVASWITTNKRGDLTDPLTYKPAFRKMLDGLNDIALDEDNNEVNVSGSNFWKAGKYGAAGNYSNEKGKTVLAKMMKKSLLKEV